MKTEQSPLITIDGMSGAGKTTLGHWLADRLAYEHCESGYLYRAIAYRSLENGIGPRCWDGLAVVPRQPAPHSRPQTILFDERPLNLDKDLFSSEVDRRVVQVSAIAAVRECVAALCRPLVERGRLVLSGRDAGTAIAPEADVKLFLEADPSVRAARRGIQGAERGSRQELESKLLADRLAPAADAFVIDTTHLTKEEARAKAWSLVAGEHEPQ